MISNARKCSQMLDVATRTGSSRMTHHYIGGKAAVASALPLQAKLFPVVGLPGGGRETLAVRPGQRAIAGSRHVTQ